MSYIERRKYNGCPINLYRLDKKDSIGGMSTPKFKFIFRNIKEVRRVFLMGHHGSYSFYALSKLREELPNLKNAKLIFLEVIGQGNPYTWDLRSRYQDLPYVSIESGSYSAMRLKLMWYKSLNIKDDIILELNSSVKYPQEVYKDDFFDVYNHLGDCVTHILPIESGNLLESLLYWSKEYRVNYKFLAIVTESFKSINRVRNQFKNDKNVEIIECDQVSYEEYLKAENEFFNETSVHLEPSNSIHLLEVINRVVVDDPLLWITSPYMDINKL